MAAAGQGLGLPNRSRVPALTVLAAIVEAGDAKPLLLRPSAPDTLGGSDLLRPAQTDATADMDYLLRPANGAEPE